MTRKSLINASISFIWVVDIEIDMFDNQMGFDQRFSSKDAKEHITLEKLFIYLYLLF